MDSMDDRPEHIEWYDEALEVHRINGHVRYYREGPDGKAVSATMPVDEWIKNRWNPAFGLPTPSEWEEAQSRASSRPTWALYALVVGLIIGLAWAWPIGAETPEEPPPTVASTVPDLGTPPPIVEVD